ncbi:MAG: response regulator [Kofleriaceae bacterium]
MTGVEEPRGVVLIVDDSMLVRRSIERVVDKLFTTRAAGSFEEAVDVVEELPTAPAALIVDINLGSQQGDGFDIAHRAHERFRGHIPTLVLTGVPIVPETTERAARLRAELLVKPQSAELLRLFLDRVVVKAAWGTPDVLDLDREVQRFAEAHDLTRRQAQLLFTLLRAAERGERAGINDNTRKSGVRRILKRTGHTSFEELRHTVKQRARGEGRA